MVERTDFDAFYTAGYRRVVGQLYAMVGDLAEAEDAVQEAYCRAWQRWSTISQYADAESWVRTVAYRVAVSNWRKAMSRLRAHRRDAPRDDIPDLRAEHVALMGALRGLKPPLRQAIVLHYVVGLPVGEVARETGAAEGTVKSRLSRGRAALAAVLGEERMMRTVGHG
jgi:RNA polymerase sigma-70 factor (ECF subfamily)